jgi:hypothetical protein
MAMAGSRGWAALSPSAPSGELRLLVLLLLLLCTPRLAHLTPAVTTTTTTTWAKDTAIGGRIHKGSSGVHRLLNHHAAADTHAQ